jgi:hypothetical protein
MPVQRTCDVRIIPLAEQTFGYFCRGWWVEECARFPIRRSCLIKSGVIGVWLTSCIMPFAWSLIPDVGKVRVLWKCGERNRCQRGRFDSRVPWEKWR